MVNGAYIRTERGMQDRNGESDIHVWGQLILYNSGSTPREQVQGIPRFSEEEAIERYEGLAPGLKGLVDTALENRARGRALPALNLTIPCLIELIAIYHALKMKGV